jgi:hypothetical protein
MRKGGPLSKKIVSGFFLLAFSTSTSLAQTLSETEALQRSQSLLRGGSDNCGAQVWIGDFEFDPQDAEKQTFLKQVKALLELGVIRRFELPPKVPGHTRFRTELASTIDKSQLWSPGADLPKVCLKFSSDPHNDVEVVQITPVQGGSTKWVGAIVLAKSHNRGELLDLYKRYSVAALGRPASTDRKIRILFRYIPIARMWDNLSGPGKIMFDIGPVDGDFYTQNVPQRLQED